MTSPRSVANPNKMHTTVCARCGGRATLSFKPRQGQPLYCSACFKAKQGVRTAAYRPAGRPAKPGFRAVTLPVAPPVSPEIIAATFPDLPIRDESRAALAQMAIVTPTPIQERTIPILATGRDVIGQARTGSGKTLAFAIPMVERCDPSVQQVQGLILVPTRELAIQVAGVVESVAVRHRVRVAMLYGGRSYEPERRALRGGAHIVIGTPGRTLDHLKQRTLLLRAVRTLVLDEADEMLDRGFAHDVESILAETPAERQTALFSATMPTWVRSTASHHLRNPETIEVDADIQAAPSVEHQVFSILKGDKLGALQTLLNQRGNNPVIVFGKTKHGVKKLATQLETLGYLVAALQGNLSQNARESVMREFRSGRKPILIATNVAARGLDVNGIGQVINYDLPDSEQLFTHRVGRTGRMGKAGEAITFITADEERKWREIERGLGRRFPRKPWASSDYARRATSKNLRSSEATNN